jgi:hypothetical protein
MATGRRRGKSLAPPSKTAGQEKVRQIKNMREAALKTKGDGKIKVKKPLFRSVGEAPGKLGVFSCGFMG